jgi:hypothetical protein
MEASLNNDSIMIDTGNDSITIVNHVDGIRGGRTLDVTGVTEDVIKAGHIIIKEDATGTHKPMPVSGTSYDSLPANHSYVGVLEASIRKSKPFAAILIDGTVNEAASPYAVTSAMKTALKKILFVND